MSLSKRLQAIFDLVEDGVSLADIGSDHGKLVIELAKAKRCHKLFCNDNKIGPYNILKNNVLAWSNEIEVSLSDGLEKVPRDIDTIVIAGMGGELIVDILKKEPKVLKHVDTLILAPNSVTPFVRQEVCKLGYYIMDEKVVFERHFYEIICFKKGHQEYQDDEYRFGPILLTKRPETFINMLKNQREKLELILNKNITQVKQNEVKEEIERIKKYENSFIIG